ncbi:MAG: tetratricopeptide repeat-containing protein kinase family protein, partial [Myxococcota bacterium]
STASPSTAPRAATSEPRAGTPRYASPEQLAGGTYDARSDQYAWCVALQEALGLRPEGRVVEGRRVSSALRGDLRRGASRDPNHRFGSMRQLLARVRRARHRKARAFSAVALVAVAAAGVAVGTVVPDDRCADDARLTEVWTDAHQRRSAEAFHRHDGDAAWDDTEHWIRDWTERWSRADAESCRLEGTLRVAEPRDSPAVRCLDEQLISLRVLLTRTAEIERPGVALAAGWAAGLPSPRACLTAEEGGVAGGVDVASVAAELAHVELLIDEWRVDDATQALSGLGTVEHAATRARVELLRSAAAALEGDYARAVALAEDAAAIALAAGRMRLVVRAWTDAMWLVGSELRDPARAHRLARRAGALLDERDVESASRFYRVRAQIEAVGGDPEAGLQSMARALAILSTVYGGEHPRVLAARSAMEAIRVRAGDVETAASALAEIRRQLIPAVGDAAPSAVLTTARLAEALLRLGRLDEADTLSRDSVGALVDRLGPDHPLVAGALNNRAIVLTRGPTPRVDEARAAFQAVLRVSAAALGPSHPQALQARLNLVLTDSTAGGTPTLLDEARQLVDDIEAGLGGDHWLWATAVDALAAELFATEQFAVAAPSWPPTPGDDHGTHAACSGAPAARPRRDARARGDVRPGARLRAPRSHACRRGVGSGRSRGCRRPLPCARTGPRCRGDRGRARVRAPPRRRSPVVGGASGEDRLTAVTADRSQRTPGSSCR